METRHPHWTGQGGEGIAKDWHPIQGKVVLPLVASSHGNQAKPSLDRSLGSGVQTYRV